jgi:hypothetical protein
MKDLYMAVAGVKVVMGQWEPGRLGVCTWCYGLIVQGTLVVHGALIVYGGLIMFKGEFQTKQAFIYRACVSCSPILCLIYSQLQDTPNLIFIEMS